MKRTTAERLSKWLVITLVFFVGVVAANLFFSMDRLVFFLVGFTVLALGIFLIAAFFRRVEHFLNLLSVLPWFKAPRIRWNPEADTFAVLMAKASLGAGFQVLVYFFYATLVAMFFYVLGEPFSSDPSYLLWATFSGVVVVRLFRYVPRWSRRVSATLTDFLIPFGVIVAAAVWLKLGGVITSPQLLNIFAVYVPQVLVLFPVYLVTDALFQTAQDRGRLDFDFGRTETE